MSDHGLEIITDKGSFTVYRDSKMNCHHFHSEEHFPQSEKTSENNYRISLWMCDIVGANLDEDLFGRLKNGERYNLGVLKFKKFEKE